MEYMNSIQMLWTLVAFAVFIGIVIWAWSSQRNQDFHEAANLVFDEDDDVKQDHVNLQSKSGKKHHV